MFDMIIHLTGVTARFQRKIFFCNICAWLIQKKGLFFINLIDDIK